MIECELFDSPDVEMYFYGELDAAERARVEGHLTICGACRQRLEDLHAIRRALASRPVVDAPPAGDWSGFTRRLDETLARTVEPAHASANPNPNRRTVKPGNRRTLLAVAATLALVTAGGLLAMRYRTAGETSMAGVAVKTPPVVQAPAVQAPLEKVAARQDRALREGSAEHLERSKLVVLGLAARDPHARAEDWQYERTLAGTLLTDTRLYRQAAVQDGASDVARVMRDLETVLLEASMSDKRDRAALERVQRLIARRDLLVKIQVMAAAGPAGN